MDTFKTYTNKLGETIPQLMGLTEIGKLLGWTTDKVAVYNNRGKLPPPSIKIGNRQYWTQRQINKWIEEGLSK